MRCTAIYAAAAALVLATLSPTTAVAEEIAEPKLIFQLDRSEAVPGQAIELELTILVPTWMPEPPVFESFEVPDVMVRLPEGASGPTRQSVGNESWPGITRSYALYPMAIGEFRIPPRKITITWADPPNPPHTIERTTDELVFRGVAPAGAEDLAPFVAADSLILEESIDGEPEALEPGAAFTRVITATITGASTIFVPPLVTTAETPGLAAYPREPELVETGDGVTFEGQRIETVTYVAEAGFETSLPPVRIRYWNLQTQQIETAELPAVEVASTGPPPPAPGEADDLRREIPWIPMTVGVVATLLLLTIALRMRPRIAAAWKRRREEQLASEGHAYAEATRALRARDLGELLRALEQWRGRFESPGDLETASLDLALRDLGAALYGSERHAPSEDSWKKAATALRETRRTALGRARARQRDPGLPALNPRVD